MAFNRVCEYVSSFNGSWVVVTSPKARRRERGQAGWAVGASEVVDVVPLEGEHSAVDCISLATLDSLDQVGLVVVGFLVGHFFVGVHGRWLSLFPGCRNNILTRSLFGKHKTTTCSIIFLVWAFGRLGVTLKGSLV